MRYNAEFEFGGRSFPVVVVRFEYSWKLVTTGSSQSRHRHVVYPKRLERTPLTVLLAFRNIDEYIAFGRFMRDCNIGLTSSANPPDLFFTSSAIRPYASYSTSGSAIANYGVKYSVTVPSVSMSVKVDTVAPTIPLTLTIIRDMLEPELDNGAGISAAMSGSVELQNPSDELATHNMPSNYNISTDARLSDVFQLNKTMTDVANKMMSIALVYPSDVKSAAGLFDADSKYR